MNTFSHRLRALRIKHNMTQMELGSIVGVSQVTISLYEKGSASPPYDNLIKIAQLFGVSLDYLLGVSRQVSMEELVDRFSHLDNTQQNQLMGRLMESGTMKPLISWSKEPDNRLAPDEEELLSRYRNMGDKQRHVVMGFVCGVESGPE